MSSFDETGIMPRGDMKNDKLRIFTAVLAVISSLVLILITGKPIFGKHEKNSNYYTYEAMFERALEGEKLPSSTCMVIDFAKNPFLRFGLPALIIVFIGLAEWKFRNKEWTNLIYALIIFMTLLFSALLLYVMMLPYSGYIHVFGG